MSERTDERTNERTGLRTSRKMAGPFGISRLVVIVVVVLILLRRQRTHPAPFNDPRDDLDEMVVKTELWPNRWMVGHALIASKQRKKDPTRVDREKYIVVVVVVVVVVGLRTLFRRRRRRRRRLLRSFRMSGWFDRSTNRQNRSCRR